MGGIDTLGDSNLIETMRVGSSKFLFVAYGKVDWSTIASGTTKVYFNDLDAFLNINLKDFYDI